MTTGKSAKKSHLGSSLGFFFASSALVDIICRRSQLPVRETKAK